MLAGIGLVQPGESSHPSQSSANISLSWTSIPPASTPQCGTALHPDLQQPCSSWHTEYAALLSPATSIWHLLHPYSSLLSSHQSLPIMPIDGQRKLAWPSPTNKEGVSPLGMSYNWETAVFLPLAAVFLPLVVQGLLRSQHRLWLPLPLCQDPHG